MIEIIWLALIIISSYSLGKRFLLLFKFQFSSFIEEIILALGIGLGILSFLVLSIGLSGHLYFNFLVWLIILCNFLFVFEIKGLINKIKGVKNKKIVLGGYEKILVVLFIFAVCFNIFQSYRPPTEGDAIEYHLLEVKRYVQSHQVYDLSGEIRFSTFPQLLEMLYAMGIVLKNDIVAQLIHSLFGILTALGIFLIGIRFANFRLALLQMVLFYSMPIVLILSGTGMIDLGIGFYTILCLYCVLMWIESDRRVWIILAAIMCGLAFGTKYYGFFCILSLPLGIAFKRFAYKKKIDFISTIVIFGSIFLLTISPWLIKNYLYTHNPLSPAIHSIFGDTHIDKFTAQFLLLFFYFKSITSFLSPFVSLINIPHTYPFLFFTLIIFFWRGVPAYIYLTAIYGLGYFLSVYLIHCCKDTRLLFPAFGPLSITTAYALFVLREKINLKKFVSIGIVIFIILEWSFGFTWSVFRNTYKNWPLVMFGLESKEAYLSRVLTCYPISHYINSHLSPQDKIISLNDNRGYYYNTHFFVSPFVIPSSFIHILTSPDKIIDRLKKENYYIFINKDNYFRDSIFPTPIYIEGKMHPRLKLIHQEGTCYLYQPT